MFEDSVQPVASTTGVILPRTRDQLRKIVRWHFYEDAFSRTPLYCSNSVLFVDSRYNSEALRAAWIVLRSTILNDVRNAVLEHNEHVWRVIYAEAVAGA